MHKIKSSIAAIAAVCCVSSFVTAQEYQILLTRPNKVGDKFDISSEGYELNKIVATINGETADNSQETIGIEFQGSIQVLAIDSNKVPSKVSITIGKLIKIQDESRTPFIRQEVKTPLLAKGTIVNASVVSDKEVFTVDNTPVSEDIQKLLSMVITLGKGRATDNDIFGSAVPRKVGDTWEINREKAAEGVSEAELRVDKDDIEGTTTLKDVVTVDGTKCLNINAQLKVKNISPPMPSGIVIKKATVRANFSGAFPVDTSIDRLSEHQETTTSIVAENAAGQDSRAITIETTIKQVVTTKYSYKK